ncbi:MAG: helix-turn-helix domain-containing protein [Alkalimonas sp.]|nr:helix-turn-helix domain-containing protein [Alkalimonas sp.]
MLQDMSINAEQVKSLRESRGWSQEQLAEISGLSLRTIQRVEAEGKGARETKLSLAAAFDVPLGRLCADENSSSQGVSGVDPSSITLFFTGTLMVVIGLIANANAGILLAAAAILISGLAVFALDQLNIMRRAAGMAPFIASHAAIAGVSILISAASVLLLGLVIAVPFWWVPASVLAAVGALLVLWPLALNGLLLRKG